MNHVGGTWVLVVGASGGVGASSAAAVFAAQAARAGKRVCLVDGHFGRGGLEVTLGVEQQPGLRWPDFARSQGNVDMTAVCPSLVQWADVSVLSASRVPSQSVGLSAVQTILDSLAQNNMTVILDAPLAWAHYLPTSRKGEAIGFGHTRPSSKAVIVTARNLNSVAGGLAATSLLGEDIERGVVVTSHQHRVLTPKEVARSVGLTLWGEVRGDNNFAQLIELGAGPVGGRSRARTDLERVAQYLEEPTP